MFKYALLLALLATFAVAQQCNAGFQYQQISTAGASAIASGTWGGSPLGAFQCTGWNAGGHSDVWDAVDYGAYKTVTKLELQINMYPEGNTVFYLQDAPSLSGPWTTFHTFNSYTVDGQTLTWTGSKNLRYFRVYTALNPSWTAWNCITAYECVPIPTQDPAVAAFCADVDAKCTTLAAECTTLHNGIGAVIGQGDLPALASSGQQTGGVTLSGNTVIVTATGTAGCGGTPGVVCPSTPAGSLPLHLDNTALSGACYFGSLIARVGAGPWQCVGAGPTAITGTGALVFAYNDSIFYDNWGSWHIKVHGTTAAVANDCDAVTSACHDVHTDCVVKASTCPVV